MNQYDMKNSKGFASIIIVLVVIGVLVLGGGTYYFSTKKLPEPTETPTLTPAPTPITSSTPTATPNNIPGMSAGGNGISTVPMPTASPMVTTQDTIAGLSTRILNLQNELINTTDLLAQDSLRSQITELKAQRETLVKARQGPTPNSSSITPTLPIVTGANLAMDCNQNKFSAAFVLVSPDPSDQKTKEFSVFLEDLRGKFEQSFKDATYDLATMKVEDIFITKTGSEDYINNPSQIALPNVTKDLISKNGDKYNFVYVFTTYDPQTNTQYFSQVKNTIKNIGFSTFDNSEGYGSSGKLLGVSFNGDYLSRYKSILNRPDMLSRQLSTDAPFGISDLIHETGHQWCCYLGDKFSGNGDKSKIEIIGLDGSHYYTGLESPAKTRDVLGSLPWVLNENSGTYFLEKLTTINDFGFNHYPIRYHPITLYAMGLLSKDQYSKEFKIFDTDEKQGSMKDTDVEKYSKTSVDDIIKIFGERTCIK